MRVLILRGLLLSLLFSLAACTISPPRPPVADPEKEWVLRQSELSTINDWHLSGRAAIINGDESWHVSITWQRHDDKYILDLSGPFGVGHAQLTGTQEGVILVDADKNTFYASGPDRLLYETTGIRMPVKGLLFWMRGLANPKANIKDIKLDEFGRLALLQQNNWKINYKRYIRVADFELPEKIFINSKNLKVKIFVDEWNLDTTSFTSEDD